MPESSGAAGTQTVTVVVDRERLRQVESLLRYLGHPPLVPTRANEHELTPANELDTLGGNVESDKLGFPVCISVADPLKELQRHLGHRPLNRSPEPWRWNLGAYFGEASGRSSNDNPFFSLPRSEPQDGRDEPSNLQDLTAAFTHLSTSNSPASSTAALFRARTPPGSSVARLSPTKGTKYYAIIVGKCTGVYYGEWYANI